MNSVQRATSFRILPSLVLVTLALALTGGAIPAQAQTYTDLHDFNPGAGDPSNFNSGGLAQGRDGDYYGESRNGGTSSGGTVFHVTPSGTTAVIFSFDGTDGSTELGGMTLGTDGNLYGDTYAGGSANLGVTFKVTPSGTQTVLHNFTNSGDGNGPSNDLVLGSDGNFYGTTDSNPETIYKVSSSGVFKTLHTLSTSEGYQGGQLIQGSDGNFYGGMNLGGTNGQGTLFKMTSAGVLTVLHNFAGTDGAIAAPGMVQIASGEFYGATGLGGTSNAGVIYKLTSSGKYTVLHNLNGTTDGSSVGVLTLATDGNVYGTAIKGGSAGCGTIFKVTASGSFSVLYNLDGTHGCTPEGYLTEGTEGLLYGIANGGGGHGSGVFFSFNVGLKPFVTLTPTSGKVGTKVGIMGQGFSSSSVVKFGRVQATGITLVGTYIVATVPAGAVDGYVTVTTGSTRLTSSKTFTVHDSWSSGAVMPTAVQGRPLESLEAKCTSSAVPPTPTS
jgi:uncharacterized repeat protein (TIGR03803 family)